MYRCLHAAAGLIALGLPSLPVLAADSADPRWFVSAVAGGNFMSDQSLDFKGGGNGATSDASFSSGFITGASVGYQLTSNLALVGEFTYQSVEHDGVTLPDSSALPEGNFASTTLALQGLYSFDLLGSERARSYLGLGVAMLTEVDIDFEQGGREDSFSGDAVGVQLLAGARYELRKKVFVDAGLRYLTAGSVTLEPEGGAEGKIEADYAPWSITLGIGWRF